MNQVDGENVTRCLTENMPSPPHLFLVGQNIYIGDVEHTVTAISYVSDDEDENRVQLTVAEALVDNVTNNTPVYVASEDGDYDMGVEISSLKMNVSLVNAGQQYISDLLKRVNSGSMAWDIMSYVDLTHNISENSHQNTVNLPVTQTRCKSLITIPEDNRSDNAYNDSFKPYLGEPRQYYFNLYDGTLVPSRPCSLRKYKDGEFDAQHLRESMLALKASGYNVQHIRDAHDFFHIARRLATKGFSYNAMNKITLNLAYNSITKPVLLHNVVWHLRRVVVKPEGMDVLM